MCLRVCAVFSRDMYKSRGETKRAAAAAAAAAMKGNQISSCLYTGMEEGPCAVSATLFYSSGQRKMYGGGADVTIPFSTGGSLRCYHTHKFHGRNIITPVGDSKGNSIRTVLGQRLKPVVGSGCRKYVRDYDRERVQYVCRGRALRRTHKKRTKRHACVHTTSKKKY